MRQKGKLMAIAIQSLSSLPSEVQDLMKLESTVFMHREEFDEIAGMTTLRDIYANIDKGFYLDAKGDPTTSRDARWFLDAEPQEVAAQLPSMSDHPCRGTTRVDADINFFRANTLAQKTFSFYTSTLIPKEVTEKCNRKNSVKDHFVIEDFGYRSDRQREDANTISLNMREAKALHRWLTAALA